MTVLSLLDTYMISVLGFCNYGTGCLVACCCVELYHIM